MTERLSGSNSHKITRRNLLTRVLPGALAAAGATTGLSACSDIEAGKKWLETGEVMYRTASYGNVTLFTDKNGLPLYYIEKRGFVPIVTPFSRPGVEAIRNEAMKTGSPRILATIPVRLKREESNPTPEHPLISELPGDTLTQEEAMKRGVRIIQGKETTLHIRETAFEPGGPLEAFNNTGRKLRIVLVDGPKVHTAFMTDPKYNGVKKNMERYEKMADRQIPQDPEVMRTALLESARYRLQNNHDSLTVANVTTDEKTNAEKDLMSQQQTITNIQNASQEELTQRYLSFRYFSDVGEYDQFFAPDEEAVFIAAEKPIQHTQWILGFNSSGEFINIHFDDPTVSDLTPKPSQTYPNPADFKLNPLARPDFPNTYPYGGQSIGLALDHELMHDKLIEQARRKKEIPDFSEYDTDMAAMGIEGGGSQRWIDSGFTDNSGYFFVWSVPQENGGGYIITKKLNSSGSKNA